MSVSSPTSTLLHHVADCRPSVQQGGQHLPEHGASDSSSSLTIHFA